jgi:WD40 repeat protein/transcriptional regulator with XRE-family HTH domain
MALIQLAWRQAQPAEGESMAQQRSPRGEEPDPGRIDSQQGFGRELTRARQRAGLTVREAARAAGLPPSTAGDYFSGRHLPPPAQTGLLTAILRACGETDPARLAEWTAALSRVRRVPGRRPARPGPPYLGLASFEFADAPLFFGREAVTGRLLALAGAGEITGTGTGAAAGLRGVPLVVVGPSGSGKSSVLRAGLVPRLLAGAAPGPGSRPLALFTPSATPLAGLAAELRGLTATAPAAALGRPPPAPPAPPAVAPEPAAGATAAPAPRTGAEASPPADPPPSTHVPAASAAEIEAILRQEPGAAARLGLGTSPGRPLIIVDQFEAVFTDCPDEDERQAFIAAVCALAGPAIVVLALRADFYDRGLRYPELARALQERQLVLGPMSAAELRAAITEPARLTGLEIADGLVELLLRDLSPRPGTPGAAGPGRPEPGAHEPGALPLLSHALLATWGHSQGSHLTVADYLAAGGISEAIARTAESVYAGLSGSERATARLLFLRLVHTAGDLPETRSTVPLSELEGWPRTSDPAAVLGRFVTARLITTGAGTARITHDALLTAWPRLRAWIDADRDNLRLRRRIGEAAQAWAETGRDGAALLRGSQLAVAVEWAAQPGRRESLDARGREFLGAATAAERIRVQADRRHARRLRQLVAALTALVLVACGLAGYAFAERSAANSARAGAMTAGRTADSREVAVEAGQARRHDVALADQLSVAAYRIAPTAEARSSLLDSSGTPLAGAVTDTDSTLQAVSLSPRHQVLAIAAANGTLRLWDSADPAHLTPEGAALAGRGPSLYTAAFSPDGTVLAAAGQARTVSLWSVRDPARPVPLGSPLTGPANTVYSVAFSPDGRFLAAGSADGKVWIWALAGPGAPRRVATLAGPGGYVQSVAFSRAGHWLAAGGTGHAVRLWDVADPARPTAAGRPLTGPGDAVLAVAFSPDGTVLAAGGRDDKVWLWHLGGSGRPALDGAPIAGATDWVSALAFAPDGQSIAAASSDGDVRIWGLPARTLTTLLPHPQPVTALAWSGPRRLITADADGAARIWTLPAPVLLTGGGVNSVAFSPVGQLLAVGAQDLQLWQPVTRQRLATARVPGTFVNAVAVSPGGRLLAAGYGNGLLQLWRAGPGLYRLGRPVRAVAAGPSQLVESVAFSRTGTLLATGGDDGTVRIWSLREPAAPRLLAVIPDGHGSYVQSVAFSPDGRMLAAGSTDDLTRLWDVTSPARPRRIAAPLAGPVSYVFAVAFSPDGHLLAVGSADKTVRLWDLTQPGRPRRIGRPLTGPAGYVYALAFSPGGRTLAAGITDGSAWLWNVSRAARPALLASLSGTTAMVFSVAFSPGGRTLAAGTADGAVRLWDTSPRADAAAICAAGGQPLTRMQWRAYIPGLAYQAPCAGR